MRNKNAIQIAESILTKRENSGRILPGAKKVLLQKMNETKGLGWPEEVIPHLLEYLDSEEGRRFYGNPEYGPNKAPVHPLREILDSMPLRPGSSEILYNRWVMDPRVMGRPLGLIAKFVVEQLRGRDFDHHLAEQPPLDRTESRVHEALKAMKDELVPGTDLEELAKKWRDIGTNANSVSEAAAIVAGRLMVKGNESLRRYDDVQVNHRAIKEAEPENSGQNTEALLSLGIYH